MGLETGEQLPKNELATMTANFCDKFCEYRPQAAKCWLNGKAEERIYHEGDVFERMGVTALAYGLAVENQE
ncbi:MAG: hypothetical protein WCJ58_02135 [bacterium]